ncbi:hypothetical protein T05_4583 [Trichinella murrelli]|uniref:Uncharacterized protein n=1 Tax=Trichinella murrelli TaxID=144512 RepID=A0A0V0SXD1_9BILA|nr:hypothetical protein T05_4583 [Trichinella murrelli]
MSARPQNFGQYQIFPELIYRIKETEAITYKKQKENWD